ncbi:MAG: phospholipase D-like domain-containing protein [Candidatus Micrarchaeota archaeon]|nr:DUF1669 domain-containing protein [Candidatus Micrarchaeota archaeon]MBU1681811.1 DUF1669 domain-containing protein [Candidatus Micrarchaeota archaeon]
MRNFLFGFSSGLIIFFLISTFFLQPEINPVFSPEDGSEIINLIKNAEESIEIEMYVFTSRDVVDELEKAKNRGVKIRLIIERSTISGSNKQIFEELQAKGFNVRYASKTYKLTHSKFMIIDNKSVLVGSHNFSNSALFKNREASVIITDQNTVSEFLSVFELDWAIAS